jgi:peptidoglycan/LPS O-acetylase OafA/YrhL
LLLLQSWVPNAALYWNAPAWALSSLAFFYLTLPLVLKLTQTLSKRACLIVGGLAWCVSLSLGLLYFYLNPDHLDHINTHSHGFWLGVIKYNPLARIPEFLIGVTAGRYFLLSGGLQQRVSSWVFVATSLALVGFLLMGPQIPFPITNSGLLAPVLAVLITSMASGGRAVEFLKRRWFMALGQSSYCLYMLHAPLWGMLYKLHSPVWNASLFVAIVLLCLGLYEWVEKPASSALRNALVGSPKPVALATAQ